MTKTTLFALNAVLFSSALSCPYLEEEGASTLHENESPHQPTLNQNAPGGRQLQDRFVGTTVQAIEAATDDIAALVTGRGGLGVRIGTSM